MTAQSILRLLLPLSTENKADYKERMKKILQVRGVSSEEKTIILACMAIGEAWNTLEMDNPFAMDLPKDFSTPQEMVKVATILMAKEIKKSTSHLDRDIHQETLDKAYKAGARRFSQDIMGLTYASAVKNASREIADVFRGMRATLDESDYTNWEQGKALSEELIALHDRFKKARKSAFASKAG